MPSPARPPRTLRRFLKLLFASGSIASATLTEIELSFEPREHDIGGPTLRLPTPDALGSASDFRLPLLGQARRHRPGSYGIDDNAALFLG